MTEEQKGREPAVTDGDVSTATTPRVSPYQRVFPPQPIIWREAKKIASGKNARVEDLALCASQDPVIVIELLRAANSMDMAGNKAPLTTTPTAIIRLGSQLVMQTLEELADRPRIENEEVLKLLEMHRYRCKRAAILSRMLSEMMAKSLSDECHTAGSLMFIGEMLAVVHFQMNYVKLFNNNSLSGVNYKLIQEQKFDVEKMGVTYLERQGLPELLTASINREGKIRSPDRVVVKPICFAASELIDAFDGNRWERLAPGRQLPPKSSLRMLGMSDQQYLRLYERATEYLYVEKIAQEKLSIKDLSSDPRAVVIPVEPVKPVPQAKPHPQESAPETYEEKVTEKIQVDLEAEIQDLLTFSSDTEEKVDVRPALIPPPPPPPAPKKISAEQFSLSRSRSKNRNKPRVEEPKDVVPPPELRTKAGNSFVSNVTSQLDKATTSEELLRDILGILTESGPFEKSALIVVAKDKKSALVVAARGPDITCGQTLIIEDPLSPLAQCFSKVQSFGSKSSNQSPWGSKAFAVAPIDADHDTPVALYADCGNTGSITFEARRIFRAVIDILNQKLPTIPGGIPVEVNSPEFSSEPGSS